MRGGAQAAAEPRYTSTRMQLVNRDANNASSLNDAVEHVATLAQLTKHSIPTVEMGLRGMRDEPLAAARIGSGERHANRAPLVAMRVQLVPDRVPRPAISVAARIARVNDEVGRDPVKPLKLEVPAPSE